MMFSRSWAFWILLLAFLAAGLFWFTEIPEYRRQLDRLIPPQATWVVRQTAVADRLPDLLGHPALAGLLAAGGTSTQDVARWRGDRGLTELLRRVAPEESVLAYVPALGRGQEPAWLLASWLGGRSQRLRWLLKSGRVDGAVRILHRHGHLVWELPATGLPIGQSLTISVTEGMAVLCLSRDRAALVDVLDGYDGLLPQPPAWLPRWPDAPGAGLAVVYRPLGAWTPPNEAWRMQLAVGPAEQLAAAVRGPWPREWPVGAEAANAPTPWPLAETNAVLTLVADRTLALHAAGRIWPDLPALGGELVQHDATGPLHLAVVDGPFAGRAMGLKLPTILATLPLQSETAARARLTLLLDQINRKYQWGLVFNELLVGTYRPNAIESTRETAYARFAVNEQMACLVTNQTLVWASNTEGFTNLLLQARAAGRDTARKPDATPAALAGWINLRDGGKSVRLLLTAWSLRVDERDAARAQRVRGRIQQAKGWVDALAPLQAARFRVERIGPEMQITLAAGASS